MKPKIKFMLVTEELRTYQITTPFTEVAELTRWIAEVDDDFIDNPLVHLPHLSFVDQILTPWEIKEEYTDKQIPIPSYIISVKDRERINHCHGTMFVDDSKTVFYSPHDKTQDWKLPKLIIKGIR